MDKIQGVTLYIASASGWYKQAFDTIEDAHAVLMAVKRTAAGTHWATVPSELDDGGQTPPPKATIRRFAQEG